MNAIITSLVGVAVQEGMRISKTKVAANIGGLGGIWALIPRVLEKDPEAIGNLILIIVAWGFTLWGRGNS